MPLLSKFPLDQEGLKTLSEGKGYKKRNRIKKERGTHSRRKWIQLNQLWTSRRSESNGVCGGQNLVWLLKKTSMMWPSQNFLLYIRNIIKMKATEWINNLKKYVNPPLLGIYTTCTNYNNLISKKSKRF